MRHMVTVKWVSAHDRSTLLRDLAPGDRVMFGACSCGSCDLDIALAPTRAPRIWGAISAFGKFWTIDNLSVATSLVVRDIEDPLQHVRLTPQRRGVVIPFELATVQHCGPRADQQFVVFGPEPVFGGVRGACPGGVLRNTRRLDTNATYYAVLEELCAPWLGGVTDEPLPTTREIVKGLQRRGVMITAKAVEHHIDYLVGLLGLRSEGEEPTRRAWKKESVAAVAVQQNLLDQAPWQQLAQRCGVAQGEASPLNADIPQPAVA